ncbi:MAG: hypothetical protein J1G06_09265 [Oscillospiraceae bacterium]|nr:hypothetical protein [Oscillospiraceae bacterium]
MFDSGITAKELIEDIQSEADIEIPIPDKTYIEWLNAVEQLLYGEIIQEQNEATLGVLLHTAEIPDGGEYEYSYHVFSLSNIDVPGGADKIRFEDIITVFAGPVQLIKTTAIGAAGQQFPNCWYKAGDAVKVYTNIYSSIDAFYNVRPALKTPDNYSDVNVRVPYEFISLVKAKLRGEAYKLANEDMLAAKWLNDYNAQLQDFAAWIQAKQPQFGE